MSQESCIDTEIGNPEDSPEVPESLTKANQHEHKDLELNIEKTLPDGVHGHIFIVTSAGTVDSNGLPYSDGDAILCGDGMIYRLDFDSSKVKLTTSLVKPPDYYADKATYENEVYHKYGFRNHGMTRFSLLLGIRNQLNTAFLPMKFSEDSPERLLVTYDAGRPYEIDTKTLEVVTPVGTNQEWKSEVNGYDAPFQPFLSTAHPAFDPHTKEMFTVNYGRSVPNLRGIVSFIYNLEQCVQKIRNCLVIELLKGIFDFLFQPLLLIFVLLYSKYVKCRKKSNTRNNDFVYVMCWDGEKSLKKWNLVLPDGSPVPIYQTIHQIGVTKDYVVIMDTSFTVGIEQVFNNPLPKHKHIESVLREILEQPPVPYSAVYIVPRNNLKPGVETVEVRKVVLPLEASHFLVDYDNDNPDHHNPKKIITLNASHICGMDVSEWMRKYDVSAYSEQNVPEHLCGLVPGQVDIGRMGRYVLYVRSFLKRERN